MQHRNDSSVFLIHLFTFAKSLVEISEINPKHDRPVKIIVTPPAGTKKYKAIHPCNPVIYSFCSLTFSKTSVATSNTWQALHYTVVQLSRFPG